MRHDPSGWNTPNDVVSALGKVSFWFGAVSLVVLPISGALYEIAFSLSLLTVGVRAVLARRLDLPRFWVPALVFIVVTGLSTVFSLDSSQSWGEWRRVLYLAAPLGFCAARPPERQVSTVLLLFGASLSMHSIVGLGAWQLWGGEVRTNVDYLALSQMAVMGAALLGLMALSSALPRRHRVCSAVLAGVLVFHVLLSGSRSALLCLAVLVLVAAYRRARFALLLILPAAVLVFGALPELHRIRIRQAFDISEQKALPPSSLRMRVDMAKTGLAVAKDFPWFGVGLGNVALVYEQYEVGSLLDDPPASESPKPRKWHNLHNDYVQLLAETGIAGFLAYCLLGWSLLLGGRTGRERDAPEASQQLVFALRMALSLFFVGGLFYKCVLNYYPWRLFVVLAGLEASLAIRSRQ